MREVQVWCNTCREWHTVYNWDTVSELNNWGCSLDLNRVRTVTENGSLDQERR